MRLVSSTSSPVTWDVERHTSARLAPHIYHNLILSREVEKVNTFKNKSK